jgi:cytochrome P450
MKQRNETLMIAAGSIGLAGAAFAVARLLAPGKRPAAQRLPAVSRHVSPQALPRASVLDTLATFFEVFVPNVAKGVIVRRPKAVAMAERMELDRRAVQRVQQLRGKYGSGPLMMRLPLREQAVLLEPEHVHRVLHGSPDPFATASSEKRAALAHLEPKGVLISHGVERADRRRFNEEVLDHQREVHRLVDSFLPVVEQEAARILASARRKGEMDWEAFESGWFRLVRRVIFGNAAADDDELSELTRALREAANWAFLHPPKRRTQKRFFSRIKHYLKRAEPGSLAALAAAAPKTERTAPHHQVPQWLFAFDPAGMATFRALALLAAHPEQAARAQQEIAAHNGIDRQNLPFLRATMLESLRLWPTTPLVLRQTTRETNWSSGWGSATMPAKTGIMIFAPYFHRDDQRLPYADRYAPELWLQQRTDADWPLIPFSGGPAICPARNLVLMLGSAMLAALLEGREFHLKQAERMDPARLPGTLDHNSLRFGFSG